MHDEVVVASFNLHWGRGPRKLRFPPFDVVSACAELDADVLVLQESWSPDDAEPDHQRVAGALGLEVVAVAPMARVRMAPKPDAVARGGDRATGGEGSWDLVLLSRLPVLGQQVTPLAQLPFDPVARSLIRAELALRNRGEGASAEAHGTLTVVAAHLAHLQHGSVLHAPALRRALPGLHRPAALVGDMNMWGWCISAMAPRGWRRAVRGRTWPAHRPHSQIDHVLVTPSVSVLRAEVVPVGASDHLPVRATLAVPRAPGLAQLTAAPGRSRRPPAVRRR